MENINKEKKSFFKSKMFIIPVVVLMLFGLVSAAVYVYVSNTSTVTVTIDRAMQTWIGTNEADTSITLTPAFAGDSFNFIINERNNGQSTATVYPVLLKITGPENFDGNELTSVWLVDDSNPSGIEVVDYLLYIDPSDGSYSPFNGNPSTSNTILLMGSNDGTGTGLETFSFMGNGNTHVSDITITTAAGIAPGTYTIEACTINNLEGADCAPVV